MMDSSGSEQQQAVMPDDAPEAPGAEERYALETRAEVLKIRAYGKAVREGVSDQLEIGDSASVDSVSGQESLKVGGRLSEGVNGTLVTQAARLETTVNGRLTVKGHNETTILGGTLTDTHLGPEFVGAGMSDDLLGGGGARVTVLADLWLSGLMGMEYKPATAVVDGALVNIAGTAFEREYGAGTHTAGTATFTGTTHTTTATGFRPLFKVMMGVRDLTLGGGGGAGEAPAVAAPPAPPPVPPVGGVGGGVGGVGGEC